MSMIGLWQPLRFLDAYILDQRHSEGDRDRGSLSGKREELLRTEVG